jgi:hypothetical protein
MAKIEMDLSEFKEMEKNAKLLKDALKREKEQQDKIAIFKEEKIKALEEANMSVTHITRTENTEYVLNKRDPREILQQLERFVRQGDHRFRQGDHRFLGSMQMDHIEFELNNISDAFFEKTKMYSEPIKTVTTKGLDEVTAEIETRLRLEIKGEVQDQLDQLKRLKEDKVKMISELNNLRFDFAKAEADNEVLTEENLQHAELIESWEESEKLVNELLNKPHNVFNAYKKLNALKILI